MQSNQSRNGRGQAMVEFALVILILSAVLMGIFDLGRIIYTSASLSNAAREGARVAAVTSDTTDIENAISSRAVGLNIQSPPTAPTQITVSYFNNDGTPAASRDTASTVKVTISNYPFSAITPLIGNFFGSSGTLNLSSSASMTIERHNN